LSDPVHRVFASGDEPEDCRKPVNQIEIRSCLARPLSNSRQTCPRSDVFTAVGYQ
jgi:hypothetical protein